MEGVRCREAGLSTSRPRRNNVAKKEEEDEAQRHRHTRQSTMKISAKTHAGKCRIMLVDVLGPT
jgi:hypothetical protein